MEFFKKLKVKSPLVVFEMANNHYGDLNHAINIVKSYGELAKDYKSYFDFGFKFQYRDSKSFIHPDFMKSDLKYIKRFQDTWLLDEEWQELISYTKEMDFIKVCTPFDENSVEKVIKHGFDILKIASCSSTDWPLLEKIANHNLPIIISIGGASDQEISNINSFLKHKNLTYAMLSCVGLYPTDLSDLNISFLSELKNRYSDLVVGFSTHEHPNEINAVSVAYGAGARIFEKHVCLPTDAYKKNLYSVNLEECESWLQNLKSAHIAFGSLDKRKKNLKRESKSLRPLTRGVFAKKDLKKNKIVTTDDIFFAIPSNQDSLIANDFSLYKEITLLENINKNEPINYDRVNVKSIRSKVEEIKFKILEMIEKSGVIIPNNSRLEISHHYGLDKFYHFGLCMVTIINKSYCKKILFLLPEQKHPEQYHKIKSETFLLLYGELYLSLNGELNHLMPGDIITVEKSVKHEFWTTKGAIIEELSTKSIKEDSYYTDHQINRTLKRKSFIDLI